MSDREEVSDGIRAMIGNIDVGLALELEGTLEKTLADYEREHEELVRRACDVPDSHMDMRDVIQCTFLGHVLSRLERSKGRLQTERLVATLLEQFETARQQVGQLMGTPP